MLSLTQKQEFIGALSYRHYLWRYIAGIENYITKYDKDRDYYRGLRGTRGEVG